MIFPRESARFIAANSIHVQIQEDSVDAVSRLIFEDLKDSDKPADINTGWESLTAHPSCREAYAADCTINHSFWYDDGSQYKRRYNGEVVTGYIAACAAVTLALKEGVDLISPSFYSCVNLPTLNKLLLSEDGKEIPMLSDRLKNLHDTGRVLNEKFGGTFVNCIKQCNNSAMKLVDLVLEHFPCYRDVAHYECREVSFLKRAQILVADLWTCFGGKDLGYFTDINELTMFADYRVPQVLRHFDVLSYDDELIQLLNAGHMFYPGERMEVEIRGCTIHAVELIVDKVKELFAHSGAQSRAIVNAITIDNYLWLYRRKFAQELSKIPFHRCRSIYY